MEKVTVHEVGPRDGLQNEPGIVSLADRLAWIAMLADAGLTEIEVGSFVSPKWVPQMAGSAELVAQLPARDGVRYAVLVPNGTGWNNFAATPRHGPYTVAVFIAASEGFSQANLNCSIAESVDRLRPVIDAAQKSVVSLRGYVSCVTDCPFDGAIAPAQVVEAVTRLRDLAEMPISLGDTIGKGTPERVGEMLDVVTQVVPVAHLAGHFHDTGGRALDNVSVALNRGVRQFDASAGGLGGCPYAPGAPGNLATERLVGMLHAQGYETGIDEAKLAEAARFGQSIREGARRG